LHTKLNILISTYNGRIEQLKNVILEPISYVGYTVIHQYTDEKYKITPNILDRKDVKIVRMPGKGVTKSRNKAIKLAEGEIGLFSDDDVRYKPEYFKRIRKVFVDNQYLDIALFKIKTPDGEPEYKAYPDEPIRYLKAPSVGTIEIAFRVSSVKKNRIYFDERFGAGQDLLIGSDEKIFIQDCLKKVYKFNIFLNML
jgi:glycosyltransferase involved in cell wall biosynthesis